MADGPSRGRARPLALRIERVEVLPTDAGVALVRVIGEWDGVPSRGQAVLLVREGRRVHRFPALAAASRAATAAAGGEASFRAAFAVPEGLRGLLSERIELEISRRRLELPPPRERLLEEPAPAPGGEVIDRSVLAERRARRAEAAEEDSAQRVREAERALGALEGELAGLELRLAREAAERADLEAALEQRERELEELQAGEGSAEPAAAGERDERLRYLEGEARELRGRLEASERSAQAVGAEMDDVRRRAAAAEHAVARAAPGSPSAPRGAAQAPGPRIDASVLNREAALARALPTGSTPAPPVSAGVGPALDLLERERRALAARPAARGLDLRAEVAAIERIAAEVRLELAHAESGLAARVAAERRARAELEQALEAERSRLRASEAARAELERHLARRVELDRRAAAAIETLHAEAQRLRSEPPAPGVPAEAAGLMSEFAATATGALEEAERRIEEAQARVGQVHREMEAARSEREEVEAELRAELERARAATSAPGAERPEPAEPSRTPEPVRPRPPLEPVPEPPAPVEPLPEPAEPAPPVEPPPAAGPPPPPWLPVALRRMHAAEPLAAARLLLELLPAQGLTAHTPLSYDLELGAAGWHAVDLQAGGGDVAALPGPRRRRDADFRLRCDGPAMIEALASGGREAALTGARLRVRGTLRPRAALRDLAPAPLRLADLADEGILPDPVLLYRALAYLVEPGWTRGHRFVVEHRIAGAPRESWYVVVRDVARIDASSQPPPLAPTARVESSQGALQRILGGGAPGPEEKPAIHGDVRAVALLAGWIRRAQGLTP